MRVNVYAEDEVECVEIVRKEVEGVLYVGCRFNIVVMEGPTENSVTFWAENEDDLKDIFSTAVAELNKEGDPNV